MFVRLEASQHDSPWVIRLSDKAGRLSKSFASDLNRLAFADPDHAAPIDTQIETFALLDAARFPGLVETLETSNLTYASLFRGKVLEELADVGPWLVRLEPEHRLTRHLLTPQDPDDPHWNRWGNGSVVLIRSGAGFYALLRHFRKYTRIYDNETGKWNYFRFYAPETLRGLIAHMSHDAFAEFARPVHMFITEATDRQPLLISSSPEWVKDLLDEQGITC